MNSLFERASVREFTSEEVEIQDIEDIIRAGMQAPSAMNSQPWEFIVVNDSEDMEAVSKMSPYAGPAADAQKLIIVLANRKILEKYGTIDYFQQDLAACTQNCLLEATDKKIGSVWLGFYPDEERVNALKEYFDIPDHIIPFAVIALGYPVEKPAARRNFKPEKIHFARY